MKRKTKGSYFQKWLKGYLNKEYGDVTDSYRVNKMDGFTLFGEVGMDSLSFCRLLFDIDNQFKIEIKTPIYPNNIMELEGLVNEGLAKKGKKSSAAKRALALDVAGKFGYTLYETPMAKRVRSMYNGGRTLVTVSCALDEIEKEFGFTKFGKNRLRENLDGGHVNYKQICGSYALGGLVNHIARNFEYET